MKNIRGYLPPRAILSFFIPKVRIAPLHKTFVGSPSDMALSDTVINGSWIIAEPVSYLLTVRITEEQELTRERSPVTCQRTLSASNEPYNLRERLPVYFSAFHRSANLTKWISNSYYVAVS